MIVKAAVKVLDLRQNREICIPCMRHCDAFHILHELGYRKNTDYKELAQGFLDEHDIFYDRVAAMRHAIECRQITNPESTSLFSEDLW